MTGTETLGTTVKPAVPTEVHGFSVKVGIGAYPPGSRSHRKAMYAILRPLTDHNRRALKRIGRDSILGSLPLTAAGAAQITADRDGRLAERAALDALAPAVRMAKTVAES